MCQCGLAQQREDALAGLVGLGEHRRASLNQNLVLAERDRLLGHVGVADAALSSHEVLVVAVRRVSGVLEAVLGCTRTPRCAETALIAVSISDRSVVAPSAENVVPRAEPREIVPTEICSASFAPTWKVMVPDAFRSLMPLNAVVVPTRSISEASWLTSL